MAEKIYDFPMTVSEAIFVRDYLTDMKSTLYISMRKSFSTQEKQRLDGLIDNLTTWIEYRSTE